MTRHIVRYLNSEGKKFAISAICIALPVLGGMFLCQLFLGNMLRQDAQNTCSDWVSMLLARNPDILTLLSGTPPSPRTAQILDDATQVGDIYRIRVWDAAGNVAFRSRRSAFAPAPVDRNRVAEAFVSGAVFNEVHKGASPQNVPYFVESFIPVKRNGVVIGVFDIFLDQTDDEILYKRSLLLTEIILGAMVLLAGGIPGYGVYRHMLKLRDARAQALYLLEHDSLTGILNRNRLTELANSALALDRRKPVAALVIDMDRFKDINDSFGHASGDQVLKVVAKRLRSFIHEGDAVARFGGDEFLVLQVGAGQPNGARSLADRLVAALSQPYEIGGSLVTFGASIGIAISPPDADDFEALISCAYSALYKSKAAGRNSVSFFEPGMDAKNRQRIQIESDIRRALETDAFQLAYQPIHSFTDGRLLAFEALLRWPQGWSPQSPADFIPVAEECGLIDRLGAWALETACKTAAGWTNPLKIAVNLSPVQFQDGDIASVVEDALRNSGLSPDRLELEVTEGVWIKDKDSVFNQLRRLRRLGVSISLDDFGTGYSSLAYLWRFPFDTLKIDQSFVGGMGTDLKAAGIVKTVTALGKILNLTITAEGVETEEQARILAEAGCDQGQGYLFGRPVSAASANAMANAEWVLDWSETTV